MRQFTIAVSAICVFVAGCKIREQSAAIPASGATSSGSRSSDGLPTQTYTIVNRFPHDPGAFTQGLLWHSGSLYEGTGIEGKSSLREVTLATGAVVRRVNVAAEHFAEGITLHGGKIFQLTWKSGKAFVYDLATFKPLSTLTYTGEGWGLTTLGDTLIMSDGSSKLRYLDPATFAVRRSLDVTANGQPVSKLNELEMVRGELWANVWESDQIARIDPATGHVLGWVDLSGLLAPGDRGGASVDVLNGIAYDKERDRIFVTGKNWPKLYEVKVR